MDEFNKIRKEFHVRQKSIYQIAKEYHRSWDTIKQIVTMPDHKIQLRGTRPGRTAAVITPEVENRIIQFLDFEKIHKVHRKQRFTSSYIFKKLRDEEGYKGSSRSIRTLVSRLRKERNETNKGSHLELDFEFGNYLQVDHGPAEVILSGNRINGYLFVASIPGACLRYCQFYLTKAQEAWGHFHELGFSFFGGTLENCIYDNDSALKNNKTDKPTPFCNELEVHYNFEAIFCNKAAGWEKGSVENAVGFCRRNFLAGIPEFTSVDHLNGFLEEECLKTIMEETHYISKRPLFELFDELQKKVKPFNKGKPWGKCEDLKVNEFQQIHYQEYGYSVPERYIGFTLQAFITAFSIDIYDGTQFVYSHGRRFFEKDDSLILDHYLDQLLKKPRAVSHAKVIKDQRFPEHILELKRLLYNRYPEREAGQQFIQTLILKRKSSEGDFHTAIKLALSYNAINFKAIESILGQLQIQQIRIMKSNPYSDSPLNDNHFCLEKYSQLEQRENNYD